MISKQETEIACQVDGLLSALDEVTWKKPDGVAITDAMTDFAFVPGAYVESTKSQKTTLTVKNGINTADANYKCEVKRGAAPKETVVKLDVYSKFWLNNHLY